MNMMDRLEKIQRISAVFRYLLIAAATVLGSAVIIAIFTPGQEWVSIGDAHLTELWNNGSSNRLAMMAVTAPIALTLILGVYWLQRLFGEYQAGRFFTDSTMRCYVWLVWLKAINFLYSALWPSLLAKLSTDGGGANLSLSIEAGTLVELIVLLLIVHLLKEAQQLNDENKAFV
jgi:hypothetical protein